MRPFLTFAAVLSALAFLPLFDGHARPGGLYKGSSKGNTLNPNGPPASFFGATPIKLRLPTGTGKLTGNLLTSKTKGSPPSTSNVKITGRVTRAISRQGGKKYLIKGNWIWDFKPLGTKSKAKGPFKFTIAKVGNTYMIRPPLDLVVRGRAAGGDPSYRFQSRVTAEK